MVSKVCFFIMFLDMCIYDPNEGLAQIDMIRKC